MTKRKYRAGKTRPPSIQSGATAFSELFDILIIIKVFNNINISMEKQ